MMIKFFSLFILFLFSAQPALAAYDAAAEASLPSKKRMLFQLTNSQAEDAIATALTDKGAGNNVDVRLMGRKEDVLFSYNKPVIAEIHGLRFDNRTHRWDASILFKANHEVVSAIPASGSYEEMIVVPVLRREIRKDAVITSADIEMQSFPMAKTRSDTVIDTNDLLGKSPIRYISAQRPIRTTEIAMPSVVVKNSMVQVHFTSDGLHITTVGQALEDGAIGDVINVRNTTSKRVIRAIVESQGMVRVVTPGSLPNASITSNNVGLHVPGLNSGGVYATN